MSRATGPSGSPQWTDEVACLRAILGPLVTDDDDDDGEGGNDDGRRIRVLIRSDLHEGHDGEDGAEVEAAALASDPTFQLQLTEPKGYPHAPIRVQVVVGSSVAAEGGDDDRQLRAQLASRAASLVDRDDAIFRLYLHAQELLAERSAAPKTTYAAADFVTQADGPDDDDGDGDDAAAAGRRNHDANDVARRAAARSDALLLHCPRDLLVHILSKLKAREIAAVGMTCRPLASSLLRLDPVPTPNPTRTAPADIWRDLTNYCFPAPGRRSSAISQLPWREQYVFHERARQLWFYTHEDATELQPAYAHGSPVRCIRATPPPMASSTTTAAAFVAIRDNDLFLLQRRRRRRPSGRGGAEAAPRHPFPSLPPPRRWRRPSASLSFPSALFASPVDADDAELLHDEDHHLHQPPTYSLEHYAQTPSTGGPFMLLSTPTAPRPDGIFAATSGGRVIRLWKSSKRSGRIAAAKTLKDGPAAGSNKCLQITERLVISASSDRIIRYWSSSRLDGGPAHHASFIRSKLRGHRDQISFVSTRGGPFTDLQLVSTSLDGRAKLWDTERQSCVQTLDCSSPLRCAQISADGACAYLATPRSVYVWDLRSHSTAAVLGTPATVAPGAAGPISCLALRDDGFVAAGTRGGQAYAWPAAGSWTGVSLQGLSPPSTTTTTMTMPQTFPHGRGLQQIFVDADRIVGTSAHGVRVWDASLVLKDYYHDVFVPEGGREIAAVEVDRNELHVGYADGGLVVRSLDAGTIVDDDEACEQRNFLAAHRGAARTWPLNAWP